MTRSGLFVLLALLASACASTKPVAIEAGDVCFHCRRLIVDTSLAAEIVTPTHHAFKFSSVGCLAEYLRTHPDEKPGVIYVTDHARGKLTPAADAHFVTFTLDGKDKTEAFAAFRDERVALEFADAHRSTVVSWEAAFATPLSAPAH